MRCRLNKEHTLARCAKKRKIKRKTIKIILKVNLAESTNFELSVKFYYKWESHKSILASESPESGSLDFSLVICKVKLVPCIF